MYYLAHHGILGQKWGIRRYQNKDGSLTPAGQRRYNKLQSELDALGGKANQPKKKKLSEMSDEELMIANNRLRMESDYTRMYSQLHPVKESMWKKIGNKVTQEAIPNAISSSVQDVVGNTLKKWGNFASDKIYEEKTGQKPLNDLKKEVEILRNKKERKNLQDELSGKKSEKDLIEAASQRSKYLTALNNIHKQEEEMRKWKSGGDDDSKSSKEKTESKPSSSEKKESAPEKVSKEASSGKSSGSGTGVLGEHSNNPKNSYLDEFIGAREASHALSSSISSLSESGSVIDAGSEFVSYYVSDHGNVYLNRPLHHSAVNNMDNTKYLVHHGIKGQKWGVRRYQYEDGDLTPEGVRRYRDSGNKRSNSSSSKGTPNRSAPGSDTLDSKNRSYDARKKNKPFQYDYDEKSKPDAYKRMSEYGFDRKFAEQGAEYRYQWNPDKGVGGYTIEDKSSGKSYLIPYGSSANYSNTPDNSARASENNPARYGNFEQQRKDGANDKGTFIYKRDENGIRRSAALPYYDENGKVISRQPIFNGSSSISRGGEEFVNNRTGQTLLKPYGENYDPYTGKETSGSASQNNPERYGNFSPEARNEKEDENKNKQNSSHDKSRSEQKQINEQTSNALKLTRGMNNVESKYKGDADAAKAIVSAVSNKVASAVTSTASKVVQAGVNLVNKLLGTRVTKSSGKK